MESLLNDYVRRFDEDVVFITLEENLWKGPLQTMSLGTMIPIFTDDLLSVAKEEYQSLSASKLIAPMLWMLGMDPCFRLHTEYRKFLKQAVEDLEKYGLWLFQETHQQKKFRRALFILRGLIQEGYQSFPLYYNYAHLCKEMIALEAGDEEKRNFYREAHLYFEKSAKQPGENALAYYQLGYFSSQEGDYEEALRFFQKAKYGIHDEEILEDIQKISAQLQGDLLLDQGESLMDEQRFEEAAERLKQIKEPTPLQNWRKQYDLGYCFRISGNYEAALDCYEQAHALHDQDTKLLNEMALAYTGLGELDQAEELLKMALCVESEHVGLLCNLSMVQLRKHKIQDALETIKKAAMLDDKDEIVISCYKAIQKST